MGDEEGCHSLQILPILTTTTLSKDLKSRAPLSAMSHLAGKTGHKIQLSNNKVLLLRYWVVIQGGGGWTGHKAVHEKLREKYGRGMADICTG